MMLTIGSMSALYKESFGSYYGDYVYLFLTFLVSSRHLLFRIFCTWDPSTHASPTLFGFISNTIQSHLIGGQTFDRPAPPMQQQLYQQNYSGSAGASSQQNNININTDYRTSGGGGSHAISSLSSSTSSSMLLTATVPPLSAADRMTQIFGGALETKQASSVSQVVPSSLVYGWQLPRRYLWFPLTRLQTKMSTQFLMKMGNDNNNNHRNDQNNNNLFGAQFSAYRASGRSFQTTFQYLKSVFKPIEQCIVQYWISYAPSVQMCVAMLTLFYGMSVMSWYFFGISIISMIHTIFNAEDYSAKLAENYAGKYDQNIKPSDFRVIFIMLSFGILWSVIYTSRVELPLCDMTASGSVARDVHRASHRDSTARLGSNNVDAKGRKSGSRSNSGGGFGWYSRNIYLKNAARAMWQSVFSSPPASETAAWSERQVSIATENRLELSLQFVNLRVLENVFLVGILPRTHFTCRSTGHCPSGLSPWNLSVILFPGGFNQAGRSLNHDWFNLMESDVLSFIWTLVGVIIVSVVLLLAQMTVLNRSYLALLAYHCLEWEKVRKKGEGSTSAVERHVQHQPNTAVTVWEPKRTYTKGDLVFYPDAASGNVFRAAINGPANRPYNRDGNLRMNKKLIEELGCPSTSLYLGELASYQLAATLLSFAGWLWLLFSGRFRSGQTLGLMWAVLAHAVATHGVIASGATTSASATISRVGASSSSLNSSQRRRISTSKAMQELCKINLEIRTNNE